ncbi:uncharacterized protein LOC107274105 [Cephus cinctus]|uniref:Uncharacterized protein LOC107274105 n=1 Tax=Cephus cinctus TaxID=211228 RepID=A0AAJ7CF06_CEPCN|nr:uncharacterized protein LOC107274105 [Cephus cinctus]
MSYILWAILALSSLTKIHGEGVGTAWDVSRYSNSDSLERPSWPRLDPSASSLAFEVRSVSGVGRLSSIEEPQEFEDLRATRINLEDGNIQESEDEHSREKRDLEDFHYRSNEELIEEPAFEDFLRDRQGLEDVEEFPSDEAYYAYERERRSILDEPMMHHFTRQHIDSMGRAPRVRREADSQMEKISSSKNVREARLNSPETWAKQPISVEFRHRTNLDQVSRNNMPSDNGRSRQAPKTDFITSHRRDYPDIRESREMPISRNYGDYVPMYRDKVRERDFDMAIPRRFYPDRYRMERDYYPRGSHESPYYYNRHHDDELDIYGRNRGAQSVTAKPKRIIYYATLPEVIRKPVDLRSYGRPYDDVVRSHPLAVASSTAYKRIPGNVDPNRFRYKSVRPYDTYDSYDSYPKRAAGYYDRPYAPYQSRIEDHDRAALKENSMHLDSMDSDDERKLANHVNARDDTRGGHGLPWSVQIGTEVNVKDDDRIPGRKIFGQIDNYDRYQSAQLQKAAPDSVTSNDDRNGN